MDEQDGVWPPFPDDQLFQYFYNAVNFYIP